LNASAAGSAALQALVNISTVPTVRDELVELAAPRRTAEAMRGGWLEGRSGLAHWYAMLLANITTATAGQEAICSDETTVRFLLAAYSSKRLPPRDGLDDPLGSLGKLIGNICALEAGRRLLAGGEQGPETVGTLVSQLADRGRRHDTVCALRNLCLDTECHSAVIASNPLPSMAQFLYPWEKATAEQRGQLPEDLATDLKSSGATQTGDAAVRHASAICLLGMCRTEVGRDYLRSKGAVALAEVWQQQEPEEETKNALETVMPALTAPEGNQLEEEPVSTMGTQDGSLTQTNPTGETAAPAVPLVGPGPLPPRSNGGELNADGIAGLFDGIDGVES